GLTTSFSLFLCGVAVHQVEAQFAQRYDYLIGDYYGYYYLRDGASLVPMEISITSEHFRKLRISTTEENAAAYSYTGELQVLDGIAYSEMRGGRSEDYLFFVLRIPFNKAKKVPA